MTSYVDDNLFPKVIVVEGTVPASPVAGKQSLWIDSSTHHLKRVNSSGTVVDIEAGGSGLSFSWTTKTSAYTITTSDSGVLVDTSGGAVPITLPTAVGATQRYAIKKKTSDANAATVNTTSSQTVDGYASGIITLTGQNESIEVESDGTNWYVVARASLSSVSNVLSADVTMTTANTAYDGPSVTLPAGRWLLTGAVHITAGSSNADATAKLWDGTTVITSGGGRSSASNIGVTVPVSGIVNPAASTTYKITALTDDTSAKIRAAIQINGQGNNASYLYAERIG
jgi:hypothetical protein